MPPKIIKIFGGNYISLDKKDLLKIKNLLECSPRRFWQSGWDSNPRALADYLISSQARYDHFDTAPNIAPKGATALTDRESLFVAAQSYLHSIANFRRFVKYFAAKSK